MARRGIDSEAICVTLSVIQQSWLQEAQARFLCGREVDRGLLTYEYEHGNITKQGLDCTIAFFLGIVLLIRIVSMPCQY